MKVLPAAPPPEVMAEVRAAAAHACRLAAAGIEVRFATGQARGVSIEVRASDGSLLTTLTPAEALELVPSEVETRLGRVRLAGGGYATGMDDQQADIDKLEQESERLGRRIEEAREDWERKKQDSGVPGAVGDVAEMDGDRTPATDYPAKD